jgi:DNA mismatch repair protein MutL
MDRTPIQQLSQSLVNRIAAGEVIERPASVVKELVENAIDAGATHITVEIEDGGRELIRVIDDGCGIPPAELPLAFASHATSKLRTDEDLFAISTMGFRGEALASIGSVSHARILSRIADSQTAWEIYNRGGAISDPQAAAGNVGTTIEVRNLFYNTPARRKFMKGSATEFGHISDQLLRTALPHPGVSFRLLHNGRATMELPATSEVERLLAAWPDDFREQRLPVDSRDSEIKLRGIIGLPELARPTQKYQQLYLNGRPIRDKFIQHALREAYRGLTEPGRHPAAVLLLEMPAGDVDVNVHPTKIEVRFRDSGRIHGLVMSVVRERLLGSDLTPVAVPMRSDTDDPARRDMQSRLAEFFRGTVSLPNLPSTDTRDETLYAPPSSVGAAQWSAPEVTPSPPAPAASSLPNPTRNPIVLPTSDGGRAIQLHNTYLVAQTDEGMIIIDQHALHERIMFEDLLARVTRGPLESQRLLIPATIPASSRQIALLDQIQPLLARLGIEVSQFGPDTVAVQAFPSFLERLDAGEFISELLEKGEQELLDLHEEEVLREILDMMSCKAAIKAGDPLTADEIAALLAKKDLVERSSNCPHGRPTTLRLTLRDLEKQFKRTGF